MDRIICLSLVIFFLLIAMFLPPIQFPAKTYNFVFMVDITRSMNVTDYKNQQGQDMSRLEKAKQQMIDIVRALPCGSHIGLGIFTERQPALLYAPIEVCKDYPVLKASISHIDWRMAWVADSNISQALYNSFKLMHHPILTNSKLVFMTDGQEAPPINPRYATTYDDLKLPKKGNGLIVGVGGYTLSPIPKFDDQGKQIGYYKMNDVQQASRFGEPPRGSRIKGAIPRNAPWGRNAAKGTEHLSSVREKYLKSLAKKTGMDYVHMENNTKNFIQALQQDNFSQRHIQPTSVNAIFGFLALFLLMYCYHPFRPKWGKTIPFL